MSCFSKLSKLLNQEDALSAPFGLHQSRNTNAVISAFSPKLLLSPLFYQDGQIFVFPRPPKLLRLAEAWTKVSHCIDAIRKDLFAFTKKKIWEMARFGWRQSPGAATPEGQAGALGIH
jgi:hypothetical protein